MGMPPAGRTKIDLKKKFKFLYDASPKEVSVVDMPKLRFLMVDGQGAPEAQSFQDGIRTLYNLAYTIKFGLKKSRGIEYPVMALEGLWSSGASAVGFDVQARDKWRWTLMMMQPDAVTHDVVEKASEEIRKKGRSLAEFRLDGFHEGLSVQIMHVGPYSTESATIQKIQEFMKQNGYALNGRHHEIYLGDPRRAAPSKLRTVLQHPVK
jgi:hypothetical protein